MLCSGLWHPLVGEEQRSDGFLVFIMGLPSPSSCARWELYRRVEFDFLREVSHCAVRRLSKVPAFMQKLSGSTR